MASNIITSLDGQATPGGSGSGNKNYLSTYTASTSNGVANVGNGNFELASVDGWSLAHSTLSGVFPTDVASAGDAFSSTSGGSAADVTLSLTLLSGGNQIAANYSADLASSGVSIPGDLLISDAFFIDEQDQAKVMTIQFYYRARSGSADLDFSGTSSNSYAVWIYDVTNGAWIQPAGVYGMTQGTGVGYFTGTFQTTSNSTQYQLALININASTGAFDLYVDDFLIGPQTAPFGPVVTDLEPYVRSTPTFGIPGTWTTFRKQIGDCVQIQGYLDVTGPAVGTIQVQLPDGLMIDLSKTSLSAEAGICEAHQSGGNNYTGNVQIGGSDYLIFTGPNNGAWDVTTPFTWASGDAFSFIFTVPIVGWSSQVEMSNSTDTRVVAAKLTLAATTTFSANTAFIYDTVEIDTHGSYALLTGIYSIPVSGLYKIEVQGFQTVSSTPGLYVSVNGSTGSNFLVTCQVGIITGGSLLFNLQAGDQIAIYPDATQQFLGSDFNVLNISRLSGPSVIAATDTVAARYVTAVAQSIPNATFTVVDFDSKSFDTTGSVTPGVSWQFVAPVSGIYAVSAFILFAGSASTTTTFYQLHLFLNGVDYSALDWTVGSGGMINFGVGGSDDVYLLAGDVLDLRAFQTTGGSLVLFNDDHYNHVSIKKVGN